MGGEVHVTISFDPPQFDNFKELLRHVVYACGKPAKIVAADLDMSPPELTQILAGSDGRRFPAEKIPDLIRTTAPTGHLIVYWLVHHFLSNQESRKERALSTVESILPISCEQSRS